MTLPEVITLLEMNAPNTNAGRLTDADVTEIAEDMELSDEEWRIKHGVARN